MRSLFVLLISLLLVASINCPVTKLEVTPGEKVTLQMTVKNEEDYERNIYLSYSAPEGFEGKFVYDGVTVESLHLNASEEASVNFVLEVPEDIKEGVYYITVYGSGSKTIQLDVKYPPTPLEIHPSISGAAIEAGDSVSIPVAITNELNSYYTVNLKCKAPQGWECRFYDGDIEVYSITLSPNGQTTLTLSIESDSSADVGYYTVTVFFNTQSVDIGVRITKSHKGENGKVEFKLVDKDGRGVDSAEIRIGNYTFFTSPEGEAVFEVPAGEYDILITKGGYYDKKIEDVEVKGGKTTDLGTIFMEKKAYYAEIAIYNPTVSAVIGEKAILTFEIENRGYADDTYYMSVSGLPDGFYATFEENGLTTSEIFVKSGESKDVQLQIYVPPTAEPGTYNLTLKAEGRYKVSKNLTMKVVGMYRIYFEPEGGRYLITAEVGGLKEFKGYIRNAGKGVTVTNINISAKVPQGWKYTISPSTIPAIKPYETKTVKISLQIPPDTIPSEYKVKIKIQGDQVHEEEEIRVVVKEKSYATLIGILIIVGTVGGLIFVFRRLGRR